MAYCVSPVCRQAGFQAENYKEIYVGLTNNLKRRMSEHKRGRSKYTRKFKKIELFYFEKCTDYKEARKREKYLKSGIGKEFLKNKLFGGIVSQSEVCAGIV